MIHKNKLFISSIVFILIMVGNLKNYTKIDILRCLLKIDKPVSRAELSKILKLGEGTIRSILNILKKNGFLDSNKKGHYLNINGKNIIDKIKNKIIIKQIKLDNVFPNKENIAVQIKNPIKIDKAYILRDIAVKNGADGAIIMSFDNDKLRILDSKFNEDFSEIEDSFKLNYNDIIIVTSSDSYRLSEHGAIAVAVQLNNDLNNLMDIFK